MKEIEDAMWRGAALVIGRGHEKKVEALAVHNTEA